MSLLKSIRYQVVKDVGADLAMQLAQMRRKKKRRPPNPHFGPPLACTSRLKRIMTRHYLLARFAPGARPVAWVTSGAPVELLRAFDFYTIYPENHGALCGAQKKGGQLCALAEDHGYHPDLCSYARIDLALCLTGKTPVGRLPRPDILFCANNICQTVGYWYRLLAHYWKIPLVMFDTPYNFTEISESDIGYMVRQFEEMIPVLEQVSKRKFVERRFKDMLCTAKETSLTWGEVLDTMRARPSPMTIFDAFGHLAPVVSLRGLPVALDYYRILLAELRQRVDQGIAAVTGERKRLIWDNIAIWYKVRELAEMFAARGMNFVTATYTNAWSETTPYLDQQRPFESMARTYSLVILNNNLNHRLNLMERLIQDYAVDGLVVHSARSCKPYSVGQYDIQRLLSERLGLPSVVIEADIADERVYSEQQTRTRLEAFFEALEN